MITTNEYEYFYFGIGGIDCEETCKFDTLQEAIAHVVWLEERGAHCVNVWKDDEQIYPDWDS